jgi:uncharacterized protein GlcG (DUF336 family)
MIMSATVSRSDISLSAAQSVLEATLAKAVEVGVPMAVAVVDAAGNLKAFATQDGTKLHCHGIAINKAYTALSTRTGTHQYFEFVQKDPMLQMTMPLVDRLTPLGGGYPLQVNGETVGAVGVSGGHYSQDMTCAEAGVAAFSALARGE